MTAELTGQPLDRVLVDPVGVIDELVSAVEPGLDRQAIRVAVEQVATNRPVRRRLASALQADPKLLTSGRPEGPVVVHRLIRALLDLGAQSVVLPRCADCGKPNPLPANLGRLRVCTGCDMIRRAQKVPCSGCGRHMTKRYRGRDGGSLCAGCRPQDDHLVLGQLCALVQQVEPALAPATIRTVVATVLKRPHYQRQMIWALQDRPDLLIGAGAYGGPRTIALITELVAAGAHHIVVPACPRCARQVRLTCGLDGVRVCSRCYGTTHQHDCILCGRLDRVAGRIPTGQPLCRKCFHKHPINHEICAGCRRRRRVQSRTPAGEPLCDSCTRPPNATCLSCGQVKPCHGITSGTPRCAHCRRRRDPCIMCGATRPVASRTADGPICSTCFRKHPLSHRTCTSCGVVERLHHHGLCSHCAADQLLRDLLADPNGQLAPAMTTLHAALMTSDPRHLLNWLNNRRNREVPYLLRALSTGECPLTHDALDARSAKTVEHLRSLLVFAGVLAHRDEQLAGLHRWSTTKLATVAEPEDRLLLRAFTTWHCLPRLRRRLAGRPATVGQITGVRDHITIAADFLSWLRTRGQVLAEVRQASIDEWLTTGTSTRYDLRAFLSWATRNQHASNVAVPPRTTTRHTAPLDADQRWALARTLLHTSDIAIPYRVAGLLILLYAQPISTLIELTVDQVSQTDQGVYLRLGTTPLLLPDPVDQLILTLITKHRGHSAHGRRQRSPWLFPGARPGQHISYIQVVTQLHNLGIHALPSRAAALLDLCAQLPAAVVSRLLGISTSTADAWSHGGSQAGYATHVARRPPARHGHHGR